MQAVGVIVEYNPFHNGHKWHIEAAKEQSGCSFVIAVMSGNFVQRGEPAILDKWTRAEMAIRGGADLIIELPVAFAVRSAQYFAEGGIRLLHALGMVKQVCFGAENADLKILNRLAAAANDAYIIKQLHANLQRGNTYAAALGSALENQYHIPAGIVNSPNNILAVEYLRAIHKFAPELQPIAITRQGSKFHDTAIDSPFASATAIRQAILEHLTITGELTSALPETTVNLLSKALAEKRGPVTLSHFSSIILAQLRTMRFKDLEHLPNISEGLHRKIRASSLIAQNIEQLLRLLKSKRYPYTRLQRILVHSLLGTTQEQLTAFDQQGPLYARILAFNHKGRLLLKELAHASTVPLITKTTHFLTSKKRDASGLTPLQEMLAIDTVASDLYSLGIPCSRWNMGAWDFRHSALYIPT